MKTILVRADWDAEAGVWVATSADVEGFVTEAETVEALNRKVMDVLADLIDLNGIGTEQDEIPVHIVAGQWSRLANPKHH